MKRQTISFEAFTIDLTRGCLRRGDDEVSLRPKSFAVLEYLVENSGRLVSKAELIGAVWPDTAVTDDSLVQCLIEIRRALGDGEQRLIKTVPRRGCVFTAEVSRRDSTAPEGIHERVEGARLVAEQRPGGVHRLKPALVAACMLVGLAVAASYSWVSTRATRPGATSVRSVAVLPFKAIAPEGHDEYLGTGIADALITKLSNVRQIVVRPTTAVLRYGAEGQDPFAAGRELKVDAMLVGRIQRLGDRVRLTVQLIRVRDATPLWAGKFDERFTDIFAVQDLISEKVTEALKVTLTGDEKRRLASRQTEDDEAFVLFLKGRYHLSRRSAADQEKAIRYFKEALALDPEYALAYASLADSYMGLTILKPLPPHEGWLKAREAAVRALEIDSGVAEAHSALANLKYIQDWDWEGAEAEFRRALDLNPNSEWVHLTYAHYLKDVGRFDEALAEVDRALAINPLSILSNREVAQVLYYARRYDEAIEQCRRTLDLDPNVATVHGWLGLSYGQKGMFAEAVAADLKRRTFVGESRENLATLSEAFARSGWKGYWQKVLDLPHQQPETGFEKPYDRAVIHARLGEKEQALEWLEKAMEEKSYGIVVLKVDPVWDSFRSDPTFLNLLRRVGLAP